MTDYKSSFVSVFDDLDKMRVACDSVYPSYRFRFYCQDKFLYIARCDHGVFRLLSNFWPKKSLYTYNGAPFVIYRFRKFFCLCDSIDLFDVKRAFLIYVSKIVENVKDSMFAFQPVLGL